MYFLGIDNGLARTRSVVLNLETASIEAEAVEAHAFTSDLPPGHREQDPSQWIRAVDRTVRNCLEQLGEGRRRVVGIGVSGHPRAPVLLDRDNRLLRAAKVRGDRSTVKQREELQRVFGGSPGLIELTGNSARAGSVAAKLLWVRQNEPHHFQRLAMVMMPHDFINYWLTGVKRTEFSEAAQSDLLDVRSRTWCGPLLDYIDPGLLRQLPPVRTSGEAHGPLRGELARGWGLSEDIPVSAGGTTDMMATLAAGSVTPGAVTLSLAPQPGLTVVIDRVVVDPLGEIGAGCDLTDRWVSRTKRIRSADLLEEVRKHYGWTGARLREAMMAAEDGAEGLLFLPGSPEAGYRGGLYGVNRSNYRPENVARAALEALLLELGAALTRMRELGVATTTTRMTGGGAADEGIRQLVADVTGVPVVPVSGEVSPAMGAALQAAWTFFHQSGEDLTFEEITSYAVVPEERERSEPEEERFRLYGKQLARQQTLAEVLRGEEWREQR